ncbi:type II toxin-antitoxin system VapB family antitoxin [Microbacterium sp. KUDC0406]|uniref:type II toxin-antitoxin system VapB family antitoxin n=1 Tax=Microbacterium sp. KUDC0406 TaxID=2909588 RepID=UPI001F4408C7|nr:type II toxin-antitoxin system VapB family antitoxin [Microbacterium sp. KUDC0406]UJP09579.1 type II toxin-antitoxin system VapB family antitoxin [Microbacterium sp. KUDC0406]
MTKTLIDVDDTLLERAMELTGTATKKAAVNEALAQVVRRGEALGYIDLISTGIVVELDDPDVIDGAQR